MSAQRAGKRDDVRGAIFKAAVELFAHKGYFATTIRDIVDKAGVTQPMVYYYFGNKEQLFVSCIKEVHNNLEERLEEIDAGKSFDKFIGRYISATGKMYNEFPEALLLMVHFIHSPEEYPRFPEMGKIISNPIKRVRDALRKAKRRGEIKAGIDENTLGIALFGALEMAASLSHVSKHVKIPHDIKSKDPDKHIKKIFLRSILK